MTQMELLEGTLPTFTDNSKSESFIFNSTYLLTSSFKKVCFLFSAGELTSPVPPETTMTHSVQVVDLMQYTPLGGVLYSDVFYLPPQAHHADGWKIRRVRRKS